MTNLAVGDAVSTVVVIAAVSASFAISAWWIERSAHRYVYSRSSAIAKIYRPSGGAYLLYVFMICLAVAFAVGLAHVPNRKHDAFLVFCIMDFGLLAFSLYRLGLLRHTVLIVSAEKIAFKEGRRTLELKPADLVSVHVWRSHFVLEARSKQTMLVPTVFRENSSVLAELRHLARQKRRTEPGNEQNTSSPDL